MVANQNYSKIPFKSVDILFLMPLTSFIFKEEDLSSTLNIGQANKPKSVIFSFVLKIFFINNIINLH